MKPETLGYIIYEAKAPCQELIDKYEITNVGK